MRPAENGSAVSTRLRELGSKSPELKETAMVYEAILPLLSDADLRVSDVLVSKSEAESKLNSGAFLLRDVALDLDIEAFSSLMARLAESLEKMGQNSYHKAEAAGFIRSLLEKGALDITAFIAALTEGATMRTDSAGGLDADLLMTLGRHALRSALQEWRRQLSPLVDPSLWGKNHCFVCGAAATLAELRGNNLARYLRCGQCGADWPVPRLQCIHCGNDDHRSLGFLYLDTHNGPARVEVCDKCRGYIKVISSFDPTPADQLLVEDLATLSLDLIAAEHGYRATSAGLCSPNQAE